jgi:DNA-binding MarR family transcriptional regulator
MSDAVVRPAGLGRPDEPPANVRSLCFQIARILRTALDRDLAPFGLRVQQAAVLLLCCRQREAIPSQIAAAVSTDTAGATGLIDHLEKNGLVCRRVNPADRRGVLVAPTAAGHALAPQLRKVFKAVNASMLMGFSPDEAATLETMLERLHCNVADHLFEGAPSPVGPPDPPLPRRRAAPRWDPLHAPKKG